MQVRITSDAPASYATGALVLPVFADKRLDGVAKEIDKALGGALADVLASGEIAGKPNELALVHAKGFPYRRVRAARARRPREVHAQRAGQVRRHRGAVRSASATSRRWLSYCRPRRPANALLAASAMAEGAIAATLDGTTYRTEPDKPVMVRRDRDLRRLVRRRRARKRAWRAERRSARR